MQATLVLKNPKNYFDKGMKIFYEIHQGKKGEKKIIGGPNIFESKIRIFLQEMITLNGYSTDTDLAEIIRKKDIKWV